LEQQPLIKSGTKSGTSLKGGGDTTGNTNTSKPVQKVPVRRAVTAKVTPTKKSTTKSGINLEDAGDTTGSQNT